MINMNIESDVLQVENLSSVPFNDLLSLYRQGYRLAEYGENAVKLGLDVGLNILSIKGNDVINIRGLATCPSSIQTGTTLTLSASASSGTAPYTYHWNITGPGTNYVATTTNASVQRAISQDGSYNVSVYVTDSCASGAKTSPTDSCTIVASTGDGGGETHKECSGNQCIDVAGPGSDLCTSNADCTSGCVPSWHCETGQTGYEIDGCGNIRYNSNCAGGGGGVACPDCDLTKNYCLAGNCIPKNYALVAGVGLVALLVLK